MEHLSITECRLSEVAVLRIILRRLHAATGVDELSELTDDASVVERRWDKAYMDPVSVAHLLPNISGHLLTLNEGDGLASSAADAGQRATSTAQGRVRRAADP